MFRGRTVKKDSLTTAQATIDYAHYEVHKGNHFYIQGYLTLDEGSAHYVKMTTPNTRKWMHFLFNIKSTGICTTTFDEDATGGMTGGTTIVVLNNDRNSSITSGVTLVGGVSNSTGHITRIEDDKWGTDGFKETIGGGGSRVDELILKQNTVYFRTFLSGAADNIVQYKAYWYELING